MRTAGLLFIIAVIGAPVSGADLTTSATIHPPYIYLGVNATCHVWRQFSLHIPPGSSRLGFPLAGGKVEADSLLLRVLAPASGVTITATESDPAIPDLHWWTLSATDETDVQLGLAYNTSGVTWRVDYTLTLDPESSLAELTGELLITNDGPEDFHNARLRLPTGPQLSLNLLQSEAQELELLHLAEMPYHIQYVFDPPRYGGGVVAIAVLPREGVTGANFTRLPGGHVRLYAARADAEPSLLGESELPYTPRRRPLEVNVGLVPEVEVTSRQLSSVQVNERKDARKKLVMYDLDEEFEVRVTNRRSVPTALQLYQHIRDTWEMLTSSHELEKLDATTIRFALGLQAGQSQTVVYKVRRKNLQP